MSRVHLNVLVVGCGNIGGGFDQARAKEAWPLTHAGAYRRHGGFRITACADPDQVRREAFRRHWNVPHTFEGSDQAVATGRRWDVVSICSPTAHHLEDVRRVLQSKPKLIFCEKPLAPTWADATAIVRACAAANVLLAVNHTRRWAPDVCDLGHQLTVGVHGVVRSVSARYNKGILNNGSHLLDLLSFWFGSLELLAAGKPIADFWPDDPTIPALLSTHENIEICIASANAADYAHFEVEIVTSTALIAMENGGLAWRIRQPRPSMHFAGYRSLDSGKLLPGRYLEATAASAANIYDALRMDAQLLSTGTTALEAQRLCEAIRAATLPSPAKMP